METDPGPDEPGVPTRDTAPLRLVVVTELCFLCEALAAVLERDPSISAVKCATPAETLAQSLAVQADVVLVDTALRDGITLARRLRNAAPDHPIIASGLQETGDDVIAWAEAGVAGYLPNTMRIDQFVQRIKDILSGDYLWPGRVVAGLLRRLAAAANSGGSMPSPGRRLTRRERQVAELVAGALSDKDIARQLNISLTTTKTHVHNLLGKLGVQHRGDVADALRGRI